jgi:hypothetical protein
MPPPEAVRRIMQWLQAHLRQWNGTHGYAYPVGIRIHGDYSPNGTGGVIAQVALTEGEGAVAWRSTPRGLPIEVVSSFSPETAVVRGAPVGRLGTAGRKRGSGRPVEGTGPSSLGAQVEHHKVGLEEAAGRTGRSSTDNGRIRGPEQQENKAVHLKMAQPRRVRGQRDAKWGTHGRGKL